MLYLSNGESEGVFCDNQVGSNINKLILPETIVRILSCEK